LLSEENSYQSQHYSLHTCTFPSKKFIFSQEELEWKGIIVKFFYKKWHVEQRLQESWWAGTWHKVRNGIDSKQTTSECAIM